MKSFRIAVLGAGSFGTVVADIAASNGHQVCLWMRSERQLLELQQSQINSKYLPDYRLRDELCFTDQLDQALDRVDMIFFAVPSKAFAAVSAEVAQRLPVNQMPAIVSLTKGIEPEQFMLMSEILATNLPSCPIAVVSGPNLAKEIALGHPSATVVASKNRILRDQVQAILSNNSFRAYTNPDVFGVELAGALKNIYAIVSGLAQALGMGANTKAMILTRSLAEMSRFAVRLGADPLTFLGLAGVGDLIVTCTSPLSRNFRIGYMIGEGLSLIQAVKSLGEVAEGVNTLRMVYHKAVELDLDMPLVNALYGIIYQDKPIVHLTEQLMLGAHAQDVEFMTAK